MQNQKSMELFIELRKDGSVKIIYDDTLVSTEFWRILGGSFRGFSALWFSYRQHDRNLKGKVKSVKMKVLMSIVE